MTAYATGPCRTCGRDDWGTRTARYRTQAGEDRVYRSRYCLTCSRARGRGRRRTNRRKDRP